jgi:hypothetical protein
MFNRIGSAIASGWDAVDSPVRGYSARKAQEISDYRTGEYEKEYRSRYQADPMTALDQMADMGGIDRGTLAQQMLMGGAQADSALASVARAKAEKDLAVRMRRTFAGTDPMDRFQQVMGYGGIAGGLTAAGQGLMALTDYVQQTMVNQESREQPLV